MKRISNRTASTAWHQAYSDPARSQLLWRDQPVPFAQTAALAFQKRGCKTILELPCGDSKNSMVLAMACRSVIGIDLSCDALCLGRSRIGEGADNVVLMQGDATELNMPSCQFDGVFCCDLLGHLPDPGVALAEMLRVCRPGALVIGNVFSLNDSTRGINMVPVGDEEYEYRDAYFFRFYSKDRLLCLLRDLSATVLGIETVPWSEEAHPGYREEAHWHESLVFSLERR